MTTKEVAERLVSLCREGKNFDAITELYADHVISVEPDGAPHKQVNGKEAVMEKQKAFFDMVEEMHDSHTSDPVVSDDHFSCSMMLDMTMKGGVRAKMSEICVYEVSDGKISREEFFYVPQQEMA